MVDAVRPYSKKEQAGVLEDGQPVFLAKNTDGSFYSLDDLAGKLDTLDTAIDTLNSKIDTLISRETYLSVEVAAGGVGGVQVIRAGSSRLVNVMVTTLGTASLTFYDHATDATGKKIGFIPANTAAGTPIVMQSGASNGIVAGRATNTPAVTVTYTAQ